ncbi:DUF2787 domain-containing protein [Vibrio sp. 10N.261.55.A7]|uniref:DUF2787 domain-containing protein n=1 Tax=Vibrio sp. 10N.261.55.A7 TaxID=1880851 RepID=UPI000C814AE2|nr:DUF2787 domain-containing protein [Vibrio sp. 10N.261.55.A7]PMJ90976.1 hypothetical protein BCU12_11015 [Vibrio sp. 10N.261.55.A7]
MITKHYGDITLNSKLHQQLEQTIARYSIPKDTTRIALNCRNTSYYKTKEGVAPVEIQLKRENSRSDWNLVFVANFTYQDKATDSLDVYLYFHLLNHWCYQPDAGAASLSHPVTTKVFQAWMCAFHEHLTQHVFDDIQLTQVR